MALPGPSVAILDTAPPAASATDTGTAFIVGLSHRGTTTGEQSTSDVIRSLGEFIDRHGARQAYNGSEFDAVDAFFSEGGSRLYFSRVTGPAAVRATIAGTQFTAAADGPGSYANGGTITVTGGVATVVVDGVTEVSPTLATVTDLVAWATDVSDLIDIAPLVAGSTALADQATITLATGADDRTNITDTERQAALNRFGKSLGPGQVLMPGDSRTAAHTMLATHARDHNRFALGDAPDTGTAATVVAAGTAMRALGRELARHIQILDPWLTAPGTVPGTTRTIPPSGVHAGLAARVDADGNPNRAVAGRRVVSRYATGVRRTRTEAEREDLADAGVTMYKSSSGVYPYDDVVPVDPSAEPEWLGAAGNRLVMRVVADALEIAEAHMFGSVSGPVDLAAFEGDLKGMLAGWFADGALYGATPADAFRVETGPGVNTPETLAARQLKAALALKISPNARQVIVNITNTPLTAAL